MPGQVQHLEGPVAQIDDVPFADLADLRARLLAKPSGREPGRPRRDEQRLVHVIAGPFEHRELLRTPRLPRAERPQRRAAQQPRLTVVRPDVSELVMTADMVIVPVRRNRDDRLVDQAGELARDAAHAHPRVHDQVTVPPRDKPDVTAHQRDNVRLDHPDQGVIDACCFEPAVSNRQRRHGFIQARSPALPQASLPSPPCTHARRRSGSTRTACSRDRSTRRPPAGTETPSTLWPPPRTPTSRPRLAAKRTAAATSAGLAQRAMIVGCLSTIAFQTRRAASKSSAPGSRSWPAKLRRKAARPRGPASPMVAACVMSGSSCRRVLVLVQVDEVPEAVLEDRVGAAVAQLGRRHGEQDAFGPQRLVVALAVVGDQRERRPACGADSSLECLGGLVGQVQHQLGPARLLRCHQADPLLGLGVGGVGLHPEAEDLTVEAACLVLVVDVDTDQTNPHGCIPADLRYDYLSYATLTAEGVICQTVIRPVCPPLEPSTFPTPPTPCSACSPSARSCPVTTSSNGLTTCASSTGARPTARSTPSCAGWRHAGWSPPGRCRRPTGPTSACTGSPRPALPRRATGLTGIRSSRPCSSTPSRSGCSSAT